jgi:multidrug efflux pump subunit AcrA (membrane-fusion protein)
VVPRLAGVAEAVPANLGDVVKKGQLLAVIASTSLSEQRSELPDIALQKDRGTEQAGLSLDAFTGASAAASYLPGVTPTLRLNISTNALTLLSRP